MFFGHIIRAIDQIARNFGLKTISLPFVEPHGAKKPRTESLSVRVNFGLLWAVAESASDRSDLDLDVLLAMSGAALAVLATSEFLNKDFLALRFTNNFRGNGGTIDGGFAQFQTGIRSNGQDSLEGQRVAFVHFAEIDLQHLAFFDFVLTSAVSDNCVHDCFRIRSFIDGG